MKIYTKTGDSGSTSLVYGERVAKDDLRVEAYGTCDEANSMLGLGIRYLKESGFDESTDIIEVLHRIQTVLFHVGAELATPSGKKVNWVLEESDLAFLESNIDKWDKKLPSLTNFILPGGSSAGAAFHVTRTIVRRAERRAVSIEDVNPLVIAYLNRLSDFLFVLARYVNHCSNEDESILHD